MESFYRLVLEVANTNLFIFWWLKLNHMPTANIEGGWKSCQVSSGNKTKQNKTKQQTPVLTPLSSFSPNAG